MITAWVPFQHTPYETGPLAFCETSHRFQGGRHLEIGDESELTLQRALHTFRLGAARNMLGRRERFAQVRWQRSPGRDAR
jgi:hypothetical protein